MEKESNCKKTLSYKNRNNYKRLKNYILKFVLIIFISQVTYHVVLYFIDWSSIKRYIVIGGDIQKNNYWIQILNLGINKKIKGLLSFPYCKFSSFFVLIYISSIFWWYTITPILVYKYLYSNYDQDPKVLNVLFKSFFIVLFISLIIFLVFPIQCSGIDLNIPSSDDNKLFNLLIAKSDYLLDRIYKMDHIRINCLPSLHVSNSWFCYIPFRYETNKRIPKKIIYIQFIIAILVFISTFVIKQHYIMDGIVAIALVELVFWLVWKKTKNKNNTLYIDNSNKF
ncbi:MAG: phosphatase PAP2 family protein [Phytoplasma sp.]|uniref:phosphatase PAP2 family protein n=1 Tax=Phytoplasma sp. TaxID=2155 RepID=UPI002B404F56|nr:phosphatase PAP2 family protein [Phytoplasma sp.]WRH06547.1 MAG: phosphatase PAP2 family protein [Phytoplasma sp.]